MFENLKYNVCDGKAPSVSLRIKLSGGSFTYLRWNENKIAFTNFNSYIMKNKLELLSTVAVFQ